MHSYQGNLRIKCTFSTTFSGSLRSPIKKLVTKKSTNSNVQIISAHLFKKNSVFVQNIQKVCNQLFNVQFPSLIFKIIVVITSLPFQYPKVKKKNCPVGRVFRPNWSRISQLCTYSTKISLGEDRQTPSFHIVQKNKPAYCHCKTVPKANYQTMHGTSLCSFFS